MRLFIAIEVPESVKKELAAAQGKLKVAGVDASWTRAEGMHLTLKFLGEVTEQRVPEIRTRKKGLYSSFHARQDQVHPVPRQLDQNAGRVEASQSTGVRSDVCEPDEERA